MKNLKLKPIIFIGTEEIKGHIVTLLADEVQEVIVPNEDVPGLENVLKLPIVSAVLTMSLN